jgi:hypothetical protein
LLILSLAAVAVVALWVLLAGVTPPQPPPWKTEVVFQANGVTLSGGPSHRMVLWFTWYWKNCWSTGCAAAIQATQGEVNFTGCASPPCLGETEVYTPAQWQNVSRGADVTPIWCGPGTPLSLQPPPSCEPRASGSASFTIAGQVTESTAGNDTFVFVVWDNETTQVSGHVTLGYYS